MQIVEKKLNEIKPYEKNPRKNDEAVKYVAESIKQFGFKVPIVIDKDGVIVCGHTRYKAAKQLKLPTVPTIAADDLTDEQIKAFRLADNKTSEFADWDDAMLSDELSDILDIDMSDFGFDLLEDDDEDKNSSSQKSAIEYFSKDEIKEDIVNNWNAKSDLKDFIADIIDEPTAKYQFNKLCGGYDTGYNISLLFNPHRLTVETAKSKDIFYGIVSDEKYRKQLARWLVDYAEVVPQSQYYRFIGAGCAGYQYVNEFRPALARDIYKKYCFDGCKVLNPCAGWGGRLIGFASCRFSDVEYVETDPCVQTFSGLQKLKEFLRLGDNYKQYNLPFEDLDVEENYFDFAFTSPPYFDTEHYSDDDNQSFIRYKDYDEWKEGFLYALIDKIVFSLKPAAYCMLNVGNKRYSIANDIVSYLSDCYGIEAGKDKDFKLDFNEGTDAIRSSEEDFIVFQKPKLGDI